MTKDQKPPKKRRLYECPPCTKCGHEQGFKLRRRRAPRLAAIKERWQCAACRTKFTSWNTTKDPRAAA